MPPIPDTRGFRLLSRESGPTPVLVLALVLGILACADGGTGPAGPRVGPEGGTVSLAGGAIALQVPSDALSGPVELTATADPGVPPSALLVPGSIYAIGPSGTRFRRLATLTLSYDPASLPGGVREAELRLHMEAGGAWVPTTTSSVDVDRHTVSGLVGELGSFAAAGLSAAAVQTYPSSHTMARGETRQILVEVRGPSGQLFPDRPVSWESEDEAVATVNPSGQVTATGEGSTLIRATADGQTSHASIRVFDCSTQSDVPASECLALIAVYDGLTVSEWRNSSGWLGGPTPCAWRGVTCENGRVSELSLRSGQYPGRVPTEIGALSSLTRLDLSTNRLDGVLPSSLGSLTQLRFLSLGSNDLTGPIPPELGQLVALEELDLHWNLLTGPIPPELGGLGKLTGLQLHGNQLSGTIPVQLGSLSDLRTLSLFDNRLSGTIPPQLGNLAKLERLALFANELSGGIPRELGNLSSLTALHLRDNLLSGAIPAELGGLSKLQSIILEGNGLAGSIPLAVAQLGGMIQSAYTRNDCKFIPPGNTGLTLTDAPEFRSADLDGDGLICGVAFGGPST